MIVMLPVNPRLSCRVRHIRGRSGGRWGIWDMNRGYNLGFITWFYVSVDAMFIFSPLVLICIVPVQLGVGYAYANNGD